MTSCPPPETVRGLRSFIGAYKVLSRVLPGCSAIISDLDNSVAGKKSQERIVWTDELSERFSRAKQSLSECKTITLPRLMTSYGLLLMVLFQSADLGQHFMSRVITNCYWPDFSVLS